MGKTTKELKMTAIEMLSDGGIRNFEKFEQGIPLVVAIAERLGSLKNAVKELTMLYGQLSESLSDYADTHKTALTTPLAEVKDELEVGAVVIDGVEYAYTRGWSGLIRKDGNNLTGIFLKGLPESWVKQKLELDVSNIGSLCVSDEELSKKGLMWKRKRTWAQKE